MKKIHLVLLIASAITALTSVYSLAAINQTYKIAFEWFSDYTDIYTAEKRDTSRNKWHEESLPPNMVLSVIQDRSILTETVKGTDIEYSRAFDIDFNRYLIVYGSMGEVKSPEYKLKISNIAQRGDVVEIVVSVNSPLRATEQVEEGKLSFHLFDIVKIDKNAFPNKGRLLFVFKTQDGSTIGEQYCYIKY